MTTGNLGGHAAQPQKQQLATIRYGIHTNQMNVVGKTVKEVRAQTQGIWQTPADASAFNGKTKLEDNYVIQEGDEIEFQRRTGEKGLQSF